MKYIIHAAYGGFHCPEELRKQWTPDSDFGYFWDDEKEEDFRTNPDAIDWVLNHPKSPLKVVEIPDNATDWMVWEYDGFESVLAVVDGKFWECN